MLLTLLKRLENGYKVKNTPLSKSPYQAKDIMVLVRKRSEFIQQLTEELRKKVYPCALS